MTIDASMAALAKSLIDQFGREALFHRRTGALLDPAAPWRGYARDAGSLTGTVVEYPYESSIHRDQIIAETRFILAATDLSDQAQDLENFEEVTSDGRRWRIIKLERLRPASVTILYTLHVSQIGRVEEAP